MFLEKIETQGFKSFANKNVLKFPGLISKDKYGLTAIVGPNGSGKSNIADAIRWVLGEQSMKILRGKKGEDVIFSGSDKKGKLGMAEVSLFLNNADRKAPIDFSEVVLTRRLYRDGESGYLINGSKVRLADVQMMLAKAKFGQRTYSVIGQGMVGGFLNTTLAERKEFFDEATGVKQFQIKRDSSLNKLKASYENLSKVNMLLLEIKPRLKSLTRQVKKLEKREELEKELREIQLKYYRNVWHEINDKYSKFSNKFLELEQEKLSKDKKLKSLNSELEKMEATDDVSREYKELQEKLVNIQQKKDVITKKIARIDAQIEIKLESRGKFDISWLNSKSQELEKNIELAKKDYEILKIDIKNDEDKKKVLIFEQDELNKKLQELNRYFGELIKPKEGKKNIEFDKVIKKYLEELEDVVGEDNIEKIKEKIKKINNELKKILKEFHGDSTVVDNLKLEEIQNKILKVNKEREDLGVKINELNLRISSKEERSRLLREKKDGYLSELSSVLEKTKKAQIKFDSEYANNEKQELKISLKTIEKGYFETKDAIIKIDREKENERAKLFATQKNIQALQEEINELSQLLNENKINSARYETRLEDLEADIRMNLGSLADVKRKKEENYLGIDEAPRKIENIKHQLELIGGIDVEVEKEYRETKDRYDFLFGQVDDLSKTIKSLENIIRDLDALIKEKFDKEFKMIAGKFEEYFKILFNGGRAKILKVMEEHPSVASGHAKNNNDDEVEKESDDGLGVDERKIKFLKKHNATGLAGIEVQATPPGKKIKTLAMLSGGERALAAIALICAIISANPSPFVVLDEADAALDEANSERLAKILDDLSNKTQFIVITHNRASMRKAAILYGVTMGDDGVSKLLSVKLDDVKIN